MVWTFSTSLYGGNGWSGGWVNTSTPLNNNGYLNGCLKIQSPSLTYQNINVVGNSLTYGYSDPSNPSIQCSASRSLPIQNTGIVYASIMINLPGSGGTENAPLIEFYNSATLQGYLGIGVVRNRYIESIIDYRTLNTYNGNHEVVNRNVNNFNLADMKLFLFQFNYNSNITRMWIDPNISTFDFNNPPYSVSLGFAWVFNTIKLSCMPGYSYDEITIFKST